MKFSPLPFQKDVILDMEDHDGRALLALDMGLGKTIISCQYLRRNPEAFPAVVVCPATVKHHWENTAITQIGVRPTVLEGQTPKESLLHNKLTVINYDVLHYWVKHLRKMGIRTVIIDESQFLANRSTQRTKAVKALCKGKRVIGLSGTPLLNRPAELWPILNMIWPDKFNSFWSFAQEFCQPRLLPWGWTFTGASNLSGLNKLLLRSGMIRRLKADVLHEFPEKSRHVIPMPLSDPGEYQEAKENFLQWLIKSGEGSTTAAIRAEKLVQIGYLKRLAAKLKLRAAIGWVNDFLEQSDEKIVLFAWHNKCIDAMARRINSKSVIVNGGVAVSERKTAVQQFRNDSKTRVFIGNIQAAGSGLDGLQIAQTCAFFELSWRPGDHVQAEDRCYRIGQDSRVFAYYLVAAGTIEERLCEIIQVKQANISQTLDGASLDEDISIYDQLIASLQD